MTRKMFDLAVKVGEYRTKSGETKGRWQNIGAVFEGDKGMFVMLSRWFSPAGVPDLSNKNSDSILVSCFEPRQDGPTQPAARQPAPKRQPAREEPPVAAYAEDEDVPF
jgi:hypothetical protein